MNILQVGNVYKIRKVGKITKHVSKTKWEIYTKGKIYLPDDRFIGKKYKLIELEKILPEEENKGIIHKRSGYLIILE